MRTLLLALALLFAGCDSPTAPALLEPTPLVPHEIPLHCACDSITCPDQAVGSSTYR